MTTRLPALCLGLLAWAALQTGPASAVEDPPQPPDENPEATQDQPTEESLHVFEQLQVIGTAEAVGTIPGSAHVIQLEQIERQEYDDVHRILQQVPGINIQEEEGYGLRPNIGIRGTGVDRSQKITLLEDGVLIAPAPYAAPSAYYSPSAGRMENFEVRKGSSSIRQGPYTTGGAINYVSTRIPGSLGGQVAITTGDDDLQRARAFVGDSGERLGWLLETYQLETDGFKRLDGGGPTGFDLEDYMAKVRVNSRHDARFDQVLELKLGKTEQSGDETYLGLTQEDFDRSPYRRYVSSEGDQIATDHEQVQLSYFLQSSPNTSITATVYRNDFFRNWYKLEKVDGTAVAQVLENPEENADLLAILRGDADSEPSALAVRNNRRDYFSRGVQAVLTWQVSGHGLGFGLRYHEDQEDRFQEEDAYQILDGRRVFNENGAPGSQANRIADAEAVALFAEDTFSLGRWTLTPGVRVEWIDLARRDFGKEDPERTGADLSLRSNSLVEVIPGMGAAYRASDTSTIFVGIHRGFSPPSPSSTDEVKAEESVNYELGWRYQGLRAVAELIGFYNDYDNLIGNDTVSGGGDGSGDQFNGGAAEVHGIEAALGLDLASGRSRVALPFRFAYSYTSGEFRTTFLTTFPDWAPMVERGDKLPYIPEHQLYAGIGLEAKRWTLNLDVNFTGEMRTRAGRTHSPDESLEERLILDLRADFEITSRLRAWAQLLNATDEVYVASRRPAGLRPGRPRAALFGLIFDF